MLSESELRKKTKELAIKDIGFGGPLYLFILCKSNGIDKVIPVA